MGSYGSHFRCKGKSSRTGTTRPPVPVQTPYHPSLLYLWNLPDCELLSHHCSLPSPLSLYITLHCSGLSTHVNPSLVSSLWAETLLLTFIFSLPTSCLTHCQDSTQVIKWVTHCKQQMTKLWPGDRFLKWESAESESSRKYLGDPHMGMGGSVLLLHLELSLILVVLPLSVLYIRDVCLVLFKNSLKILGKKKKSTHVRKKSPGCWYCAIWDHSELYQQDIVPGQKDVVRVQVLSQPLQYGEKTHRRRKVDRGSYSKTSLSSLALGQSP